MVYIYVVLRGLGLKTQDVDISLLIKSSKNITLRICQQLASAVRYIERRLLSSVTLASDLPQRTIRFCSLLFSVFVHAAVIDR